MQEGASDAEIQHVIDRLIASGFNVHRSTGDPTPSSAPSAYTAISIIAISNSSMACAKSSHTQPFKLASREFKPEGTIVDLGRGVKSAATKWSSPPAPAPWNPASKFIPSPNPWLIRSKILRAGAFKPRTSPTPSRAWAKKVWS